MQPFDIVQIDALAAPAEDGGILVWPNDRSLIELAESNHELRQRYEFRLGDRVARELICASDGGRLVFMTGHQPAFFHPGVWVKNVAAAHLARACGRGDARFLVVDSDVPGALAIEWPDDSGPICRVGRVAVRSHKDWQSYEQIGAETSREMAMALAALPERIDPDRPTAIGLFRSAFSDEGGEVAGSSAKYVARWIHSMEAIDEKLGKSKLRYVRIGGVMQFGGSNPIEHELGLAASAFVNHLVSHAGHFAKDYNAAITAYRKRNGIRGTQHPIPDLHVDGNRIELPFWSISPNGPRRRVFAEATRGNEVNLFAENEPIGIAGNNAAPPASLRPRALSQTLFMRLFACDLFIHGIGGAKYDTITDGIMRAFFKVEPPGYACVSATMRLPVRRFGVSAVQVAGARRAVRDVRYNAPRYLRQGETTPHIEEWVGRRANAIIRSNQLREERWADRDQRRAAYQDIRRANESLTRVLPELEANASRVVMDLERQFESDKLANSREWFVALQSEEALQRLACDVRSAVSGGASVD